MNYLPPNRWPPRRRIPNNVLKTEFLLQIPSFQIQIQTYRQPKRIHLPYLNCHYELFPRLSSGPAREMAIIKIIYTNGSGLLGHINSALDQWARAGRRDKGSTVFRTFSLSASLLMVDNFSGWLGLGAGDDNETDWVGVHPVYSDCLSIIGAGSLMLNIFHHYLFSV